MMLDAKKVRIVLGVFLGFVVLLILLFLITNKVSAEEMIKRNISTYLDDKGIHYSSVGIDNQVLSIKLISKGEDRCTIDDVKAIQAVYEVVHGQTVSEKIEDVSIEVYDVNNKRIYDYYENEAFSSIDDAELLVKYDPVSEKELSDEEIILDAEDRIAGYSYTICHIDVEKAEEIMGRKLELVLCENGDCTNVTGDTTSIYESLEAYALSTGAITQCEITVLDSENECVIYMAGDFQYGNVVAWINPEAESAFIAHEGPRNE